MNRTDAMFGMGWLPEYPDFRDYTADHDEVKGLFKAAKMMDLSQTKQAPSVDLSPWCSPVEHQGSLGSCTAQAGAGLVEYFERRAFGKHIDASRLFLYKASRNLLGWTGDTGAFIRTTMAALTLFGVPPEKYWPYVIADFDEEPSAFCYAFAQKYQAIKYVRLDPPGTAKKKLLSLIKIYLMAGFPSMFGFTVYNSIGQVQDDGAIPYPTPGEAVVGGHAVVAVGFDNGIEISNQNSSDDGQGTTKGAFLIRNSWGTGWGTGGYGWLPYEYVLNGQAIDWWTLISQAWVDTGVFGL